MLDLVNIVVSFELSRELSFDEAMNIAKSLGKIVRSRSKKASSRDKKVRSRASFRVPGIVLKICCNNRCYKAQLYRRYINIGGVKSMDEIKELSEFISRKLAETENEVRRIIIRNMIYVADTGLKLDVKSLGATDVFPGAVIRLGIPSVLVYSSGKVIIPGVRSREEAEEILKKLINYIKNTDSSD
jgi:TATA-box binding protein (TBP) (component of TFIID and TFIIIB)